VKPPTQRERVTPTRGPPLVICRQITAGQRMKAKATALMLADLGVLKSHSRPHTSNDTPASEAHFKTLKYQLEFPNWFQTTGEARTLCRRFFAWYNEDHHHAGIGLMTPDPLPTGPQSTSPAKPPWTPPSSTHPSASSASVPNHPKSRWPSGPTRR
jgi:transposase InsO family protein